MHVFFELDQGFNNTLNNFSNCTVSERYIKPASLRYLSNLVNAGSHWLNIRDNNNKFIHAGSTRIIRLYTTSIFASDILESIASNNKMKFVFSFVHITEVAFSFVWSPFLPLGIVGQILRDRFYTLCWGISSMCFYTVLLSTS